MHSWLIQAKMYIYLWTSMKGVLVTDCSLGITLNFVSGGIKKFS